ncbi:Sorting nexin-9 [Trichinella sp. T6]|nr:Sorting nexin-9 [Trichinella sp. T6]
MLKVQVLYDFDAQPGSGELSVQTGEYLTVTRQDVGDGWWEGLNSRGEHGLFPQARQSDSRLLRKKAQYKLSIEREGVALFDFSKKPLSQASSSSGVR